LILLVFASFAKTFPLNDLLQVDKILEEPTTYKNAQKELNDGKQSSEPFNQIAENLRTELNKQSLKAPGITQPFEKLRTEANIRQPIEESKIDLSTSANFEETAENEIESKFNEEQTENDNSSITDQNNSSVRRKRQSSFRYRGQRVQQRNRVPKPQPFKLPFKLKQQNLALKPGSAGGEGARPPISLACLKTFCGPG